MSIIEFQLDNTLAAQRQTFAERLSGALEQFSSSLTAEERAIFEETVTLLAEQKDGFGQSIRTREGLLTSIVGFKESIPALKAPQVTMLSEILAKRGVTADVRVLGIQAHDLMDRAHDATAKDLRHLARSTSSTEFLANQFNRIVSSLSPTESAIWEAAEERMIEQYGAEVFMHQIGVPINLEYNAGPKLKLAEEHISSLIETLNKKGITAFTTESLQTEIDRIIGKLHAEKLPEMLGNAHHARIEAKRNLAPFLDAEALAAATKAPLGTKPAIVPLPTEIKEAMGITETGAEGSKGLIDKLKSKTGFAVIAGVALLGAIAWSMSKSKAPETDSQSASR